MASAELISNKMTTQNFIRILCLLMTLIVAFVAVSIGVSGIALLYAIPIALLLVGLIAKKPTYSLHFALVAGFFAAGSSRYISAPTGLMIDLILALGLVLALSKREKTTSNVSVWLIVLFGGWMALTLLQLGNPEARSTVAWFYAMRGVALYPFLICLIGYLLSPNPEFFNRFWSWWAALSVLSSLWGLKQLAIGLDPFETAWLSQPGNLSTHMLFGKLRVFSFLSDSGQFGAAQGHMLVFAGILSLSNRPKSIRLVWAIIAALSLIGLLISGTRGAMAVPAFGGLAYLILCKNWKLLFVGLIVMGSTYGVLRYTFIANEIYEVRRMRMAVIEGSDNASFQVRRTNQKRLSIYLKNRPFGGGIGSAGYWGGRFSSGTFLAELALDSWYVKIWAEYGITGLISYLLMLGGLVFFSLKTLLREQDPYLRQTMLAAFCGLIGILAASYGNQVFGQIPTGVIVPVSLIFLVRNPDSKA